MTRYLIVDDETIAHDIIKGYCDLLPNLQLVKNCYDAIEALECLNEQEVDLIFLDLNMPKLKGFEFLRTLAKPPQIIVTTAYQAYALEGYELNIVDYLLKPFSFERFLKAVNKAINVGKQPAGVDAKTQLPKRIFIKSNKKYIQVNIEEILYLEASGNYSKIIFTNNTITIREKISDLLALLNHDGLFQVHKSFAVAKKHISSIEGNRVFIGEFIVPVGKTYRLNISKLLE